MDFPIIDGSKGKVQLLLGGKQDLIVLFKGQEVNLIYLIKKMDEYPTEEDFELMYEDELELLKEQGTFTKSL